MLVLLQDYRVFLPYMCMLRKKVDVPGASKLLGESLPRNRGTEYLCCRGCLDRDRSADKTL